VADKAWVNGGGLVTGKECGTHFFDGEFGGEGGVGMPEPGGVLAGPIPGEAGGFAEFSLGVDGHPAVSSASLRVGIDQFHSLC